MTQEPVGTCHGRKPGPFSMSTGTGYGRLGTPRRLGAHGRSGSEEDLGLCFSETPLAAMWRGHRRAQDS